MLPKLVLILSLCGVLYCNPYDDGKYKPIKYKVSDDGKYYRPLSEGKYIPGDEGKYTYIYRQGLYPTDDGFYGYIHQVGPDGGSGPDGRDGGGEGYEYGPPNPIEYVGRKIYAERYPYLHRVIDSIVDEFVSPDNLATSPSTAVNKEVAAKCEVAAERDGSQCFPNLSAYFNEGKLTLGSVYNFKGTRVLGDYPKKVKLEYELVVKVVEAESKEREKRRVLKRVG